MFGANENASGKPSALRWNHLAKQFWHHYVALVVLALLLYASEFLEPYRHVLYSKTDEELWKYSFPLRRNTVPAWAVPTVAILSPLLVVFAGHATGQSSAYETHHAAMSAITCVLFTGLATNFIKVNVGRFRPNFVERCWPHGAVPEFDVDGRPVCADAALDPLEGMKSFPSGHTAWSTSGLGWLSFYLMGKLRCFAGGAGANQSPPFNLMVAMLPFAAAVWIGASRLQDYWHHPEDVAAGFALGFVMAWLFYRSTFEGVMTQQAGTLVAPSHGSRSRHGSSQSVLNNDIGGLEADDSV